MVECQNMYPARMMPLTFKVDEVIRCPSEFLVLLHGDMLGGSIYSHRCFLMPSESDHSRKKKHNSTEVI